MKTVLVAATIALAPFAADAVAVSPGDTSSLVDIIVPGGTVTFEFDPTERLKLGLAFAATSPTGEANLQIIEFGFSDGDPVNPTFFGPTFGFSDLNISPGPSAGTFIFPDIIIDDTLFLTVKDGVSAPVGLSISYAATPVPLPPAAAALGAALFGLYGVSRRKKPAKA